MQPNTINAGIVTYNSIGQQPEISITPNDQVEIRIVDPTNSVRWSVLTRILPISSFPNSALITDSDSTLAFTGTKGIVTAAKISGFAINIINLGSASSINLEYRCPYSYNFS